MLASSPASAEKVCTTPSSASAHANDMYLAQERCWKNLDTKGKALFGQSYMGMEAFTPTFPPHPYTSGNVSARPCSARMWRANKLRSSIPTHPSRGARFRPKN
jgi:hypothetical protein